ncbi:MAG TPA: TonB C-terminal domain-containing protein [Blastocatellia bacterium]|nr:TonB C-terminal domain-containing protein [Blastocatellia bacterium]
MLKTLNQYIEEQPSRGVRDRVRVWLRDERVFVRLLAVSVVLHICFYAGIILLNSWEMRQIKPRRPQGVAFEVITEIAPPPTTSRLRTPTVALERAETNRFEYDPQTANDTDLIARSPNPSTQRGSKGARPTANEVEAQIRSTRGGGSQRNSPERSTVQPPPVIAAVPSARAPQPAVPAAAAVPGVTPPAPPAPRPAPDTASEPAAGTQRGTSSEATAFGTQRISAQYIALVRAKVRRVNENYMPRDFVNTTLSHEVFAEFSMVLNRGGRIASLTLVRPSGYKALDDIARQAIFNASPFEGYPQTAGDTIPLTVTVYYNPSR